MIVQRRWRGAWWTAEASPSNIPIPRVDVYADGDTWSGIAMSIGSRGHDPIVGVEVNLDGTRPGRWLCSAVWWWRRHRGR